MSRNLKIYLPILLFIMAIGIPARTHADFFPSWYVAYMGDLLWAMAVYLICCLAFRLRIAATVGVALAVAYGIELSQLFHPQWLEELRSIKLFAMVLGYGFLWTDILAYTLGIALASAIDRLLGVDIRAS